jgi:hypothetical protein
MRGPPQWLTWDELAAWAQQFGSGVRAASEQPARQDLSREVLAKAIAYADGDGRKNAPFMGLNEGTYGVAGMRALAAAVADTALPADALDDAWKGCHGVNRQATGRQQAALWLRRLAARVPEDMAGHLRAAAELYDQEYAAWAAFRTELGAPVGAPPTTLRERWADSERRTRGADWVNRAANLEMQAVAEIQAALAADKAGSER